MKSYKILLVDDDSCILSIVSKALECEGYQITSESSAEAAIKALHEKNFDLVITDLEIGKANGIDVLREAKKVNPETTVLMFTGSPIDALRLGADDYISKPCGLAQLCETVTGCLERSAHKRRTGNLGGVAQAGSSS